MKKLMMMFAVGAAAMLAGCSATKVEFEKNAQGETKYRIYRNSHWLKTDAEGLSGGMSESGKFEIALDGVKSSPSEEFNRTMKTYTSAFVQLMQIAAAAYNPSASAALAAQQTTPSPLAGARSVGGGTAASTAASTAQQAADGTGGAAPRTPDAAANSATAAATATPAANSATAAANSATASANCADGTCVP